MNGVLVRMLERFGPLPEQERRSVEAVRLDHARVEADRDLLHGGVAPSHCPVLLEGFACRYKVLEDGRRQILAFYVPGDPCDLAGLMWGEPSHSTCTLTHAWVVFVPQAVLLDWAKRHPSLNEALWRAALADATDADEWVINVGRRTAQQRTAHLLCELVLRLRAAAMNAEGQSKGFARGSEAPPCRPSATERRGIACGDEARAPKGAPGSWRGPAYALPLTTSELADALGLTPVHVGRMLHDLRDRGLAEFAAGVLTVYDWPGLKHAAGFEPRRSHRPGSAGWERPDS